MNFRIPPALAAALALLIIGVNAQADLAPIPGSPEERALELEMAKTCRSGETAVVCGVRAGVGWHDEKCDKYENNPSYYRLKSFKYEETYCKLPPGQAPPAPNPVPAPSPGETEPAAPEENKAGPWAVGAVLAAMALGGLALRAIRRRRAPAP